MIKKSNEKLNDIVNDNVSKDYFNESDNTETNESNNQISNLINKHLTFLNSKLSINCPVKTVSSNDNISKEMKDIKDTIISYDKMEALDKNIIKVKRNGKPFGTKKVNVKAKEKGKRDRNPVKKVKKLNKAKKVTRK